jgi:hypothetical protein
VANELDPADVDLGAARYPWDKWTNGNAWEVWRGVDYSASTRSFQAYLYQKALQLGLAVETKIIYNGHPHGQEGVLFRFHEHTEV